MFIIPHNRLKKKKCRKQMSFTLQDPRGVLSKPQKEKIKKWFRTHFRADRTDYNMVLSEIHYPESVAPYTTVEIQPCPEIQGHIIRMGDKPTREVLRKRLRARLELRNNDRVSVKNKGEDWECYHKLLRHPALRSLSPEQLLSSFPNPDLVRQQRAVYEPLAQSCPNPAFKDYFQLCLSSG